MIETAATNTTTSIPTDNTTTNTTSSLMSIGKLKEKPV